MKGILTELLRSRRHDSPVKQRKCIQFNDWVLNTKGEKGRVRVLVDFGHTSVAVVEWADGSSTRLNVRELQRI